MLQRPLKSALFVVGLGLAAGVVPDFAASAESTLKASDWLGHSVTTRDGKELGTVRDLALDERSGKVLYLVVSVGSFLIENNLIAIAPDALVPAGSADGAYLLLADPNGLRDVKRFASNGHWPSKADVVRDERVAAPAVANADASETAAPAPPPPTGTATIESRSKTAKLSANERVITQTQAPAPTKSAASLKAATPTAARPPPLTQFDHLDKDGDGVLNRSEFAQVISPKDSYSKIDTNANGVIEPQEFDAYQTANRSSN